MKGLTRGLVGALALLVAFGTMATAGGRPPGKGRPPARKGGPGLRDDRRGPSPGDRDRPTRPDAQGANTPNRPGLDGKGGDVAQPPDKGFKESLPDDIHSPAGRTGANFELGGSNPFGGAAGRGAIGGGDRQGAISAGISASVNGPLTGGGTHRLDGKGGDISSLDGKGNDMSSLDGKGNDYSSLDWKGNDLGQGVAGYQAGRTLSGQGQGITSEDDWESPTALTRNWRGDRLSGFGQGQGITAEDDWESPTAVMRNWDGNGLYGSSGITFDASLRPRLEPSR